MLDFTTERVILHAVPHARLSRKIIRRFYQYGYVAIKERTYVRFSIISLKETIFCFFFYLFISNLSPLNIVIVGVAIAVDVVSKLPYHNGNSDGKKTNWSMPVTGDE